MQIEVNDDRMSAIVAGHTMKVGDAIPVKKKQCIILAFAIIDKKDMAAPWVYIKEAKTGETDWISLRNWLEAQEKIEVPKPQTLEDNDLI